jgi:hypothetical protein
MSQILTLELSDRVDETLARQAEIAGISLTEWVAISPNKQCGMATQKEQTEAEKEAAIQRFRRHAGAIDMGYPTGADNESIDTVVCKN